MPFGTTQGQNLLGGLSAANYRADSKLGEAYLRGRTYLENARANLEMEKAGLKARQGGQKKSGPDFLGLGLEVLGGLGGMFGGGGGDIDYGSFAQAPKGIDTRIDMPGYSFNPGSFTFFS
tara:strand:+ start:298 stop:657 length:360 start_codon:yes stop_codon:yes gene_type:complete